MNNRRVFTTTLSLIAILAAALVFVPNAAAQEFNFKSLEKKVQEFSVTIEMDLEVSFGIHTNEQSERYLGTIVSDSGLVMFDASAIASDNAFPSFSSFSVKTVPGNIKITTLDGTTYDGEYLGHDRYTSIGFIMTDADGDTFKPVEFRQDPSFRVGEWLALYMLLPEFISPPLSADVGMISTLVTAPEEFALTVGFNSLQMTSVLFNEKLEAVGVLGSLMDPGAAGSDASGMIESFGQFGIPLLGVVTPDRLNKLIADPPRQGEVDRGWLGITLQALTSDMAEFWDLQISGGIIVNDVVKQSPAAQAGLEVGDIIFEVNGEEVAVDKDEKLPVFQRKIAEMGPGSSVELSVVRRQEVGADTLHLLVTLGEAPIAAADADEYEIEELEFKARNMVFSDYMIINQDPEEFSGAVVSEIEMGGLADISGLRIGDIIQRVGQATVSNVEELETAMESVTERKPREVILFVWRAGKTLFVNIKTDWQ